MNQRANPMSEPLKKHMNAILDDLYGQMVDNICEGRKKNAEEVKKLIDLTIDKEISELEIERPGFRVRISRHTSVAAFPQHAAGGESAAAAVDEDGFGLAS